MCRNLNIPIKDDTILQTWTRTSVKNDLELSQIAQQSSGVISDETIITNHPWVENPTEEIDRLKQQKEENMDTFGFPPSQEPNPQGKRGPEDQKEGEPVDDEEE